MVEVDRCVVTIAFDSAGSMQDTGLVDRRSACRSYTSYPQIRPWLGKGRLIEYAARIRRIFCRYRSSLVMAQDVSGRTRAFIVQSKPSTGDTDG